MTRMITTFLAAATLYGGLAATAQAASCYDLWYERNSIYANYGYCFRSQLGIETFGAASDCTRNPKLSRADQRRVDQIKAEERRRSCNVN